MPNIYSLSRQPDIGHQTKPIFQTTRRARQVSPFGTVVISRRIKPIIQLYVSHGTMPKPTQGGPDANCPPKRNGKRRREDHEDGSIRGGTSGIRRNADTSITKPVKPPHPCMATQRAHPVLARSIKAATSWNGARTGMIGNIIYNRLFINRLAQ